MTPPAAGPPAVDAPATCTPLGGGAFELRYDRIDLRALEQLRAYVAYLARDYPGWKARLLNHPRVAGVLGVSLFVFPAAMALRFLVLTPPTPAPAPPSPG